MLLFLAAALAQDTGDVATDSVSECSAYLIESYPMPNVTGVPLDAQPALVIESYCPGMSTTVELAREDNGELVLRKEQELPDYWNLARIAPPELLQPDTRYIVQVYGDYTGVAMLAFTTGSELAVPFTGAPEIRRTTCDGCDEDSGWDPWSVFVLRVRPVPDTYNGSVLAVYAEDDPDESVEFALAGDREAMDIRVWIERSDSRDRGCFTVVQTDATNREVGRSEPSCADRGPMCGCATGSPEPSLLGSLGLLLLRRRRGARAPFSAAG